MVGPINWVSGTPRDAVEAYIRWQEAIEQADAGELNPLTDLIRSDCPLGPEARILFADLLERHTLGRRRGGQATPAYRMTPAEAQLEDGARLVAYHKRHGMKEEDAVRQALLEQAQEGDTGDVMAPDADWDEMNKLLNYVHGKHGSSRRKARRRRP